MGLATVLLVAGLLVVTMRDIIRCALAMIVCFAALAGLYVMASAPFVAAAEVLVYIGAISVLVLFAIMLTQTKAAPSRLVFQTQAAAGRWSRACCWRSSSCSAVVSTAWPVAPGLVPTDTVDGRDGPVRLVRPPVRDRQRPAAGGRDRRRVPRQARARGRRLMLSALDGIAQSLDAYLVLAGILFAIGAFGFLARRNAISMLMSIELMLNGVNLSIIAFGAFTQKVLADGTVTHPLNPNASVIALVVMAAAAAEATIGLAIVIAIYRNRKTPLVDEYDAMRQ